MKTTKQQKIEQFNPDGVGLKNANIFGLPFTFDESEIIILPVPWELTVSYGAGTARGAQAVFDASSQIDLFDFDCPQQWHSGYFMQPVSETILAKNDQLRPKAAQYISFLEEGGTLAENKEMQTLLNELNKANEQLKVQVYSNATKVLEAKKTPIILGGDHSTPLGLMQAIDEKYSDWGILQIDAHADLRPAYEGFELSHASIMYNALQLTNLTKLVSVGVRDLCNQEYELAKNDERIFPFYHHELINDRLENIVSWKYQCAKIIEQLPQNVYISFDIDGLQPEFCPNTGTPVVGGLSFDEAIFLIKMLVESGRTIIAADLCEVSLGVSTKTVNLNEYNAMVGCRVLYQLCNFAAKSKRS